MIARIRSWLSYISLRRQWTQSPDSDCYYRDLWIIEPTEANYALYHSGRRTTRHPTLRDAMQTAADTERLRREQAKHSAQSMIPIDLED